ncbi:MAG TPA: carboxypeptidase-like regulatory domain-containing protein [Thermoanaerobaculia bacterium]
MLPSILAAVLILSGDVRTVNGLPVSAATIEWNGSERTVSDAGGHFTAVPAGAWPADLTVSAPGFGTVVVPVPHVRRTTSLPPITLDRGATVRVHLRRGRRQRALAVRVGISGDDGSTRWIQRRMVAGSDDIVFPDLARGIYTVLVEGSEPLQHITAKAVVAAGDVLDIDVNLPARRSRLRVLRGDQPVASAHVQFESIEGQWQGSIATNAGGWIDTPIWDFQGQFKVRLPGTSSAVSIVRMQTLTRTATIRFPDRTLKGVVVDTQDKPIAGAVATLVDTEIGEGTGSFRARSDAEGRFAFEGVAPGDQLVHVTAPGYLLRDAERFTDDLKVTLSRGYRRDLVIEQSDGTAVRGAEALCVANGKVRARAFSGTDGHLALATPVDAPSTVYVIPSDGSFAIRHFRAPMDEASSDPVTIRVAPSTSSLRVRTLTTAGVAVPNVKLLLRYEGELIPTPIAQALERVGGLQFHTGPDGEARFDRVPEGVYEIWPYFNEDEVSDLLNSIGAVRAPISLNAAAGETEVTIRLSARP